MSATFVTDLCTAIVLSAIFITPNLWFPVRARDERPLRAAEQTRMRVVAFAFLTPFFFVKEG